MEVNVCLRIQKFNACALKLTATFHVVLSGRMRFFWTLQIIVDSGGVLTFEGMCTNGNLLAVSRSWPQFSYLYTILVSPCHPINDVNHWNSFKFYLVSRFQSGGQVGSIWIELSTLACFLDSSDDGSRKSDNSEHAIPF